MLEAVLIALGAVVIGIAVVALIFARAGKLRDQAVNDDNKLSE